MIGLGAPIRTVRMPRLEPRQSEFEFEFELKRAPKNPAHTQSTSCARLSLTVAVRLSVPRPTAPEALQTQSASP